MTRFFSSDSHFGHENIRKFCPASRGHFNSVQEMNEGLIEAWNRVVGRDDTVIHLGDLAMGNFKDSMACSDRLNGKRFLIAGNHDRHWSGAKQPAKWHEVYASYGWAPLPERFSTYIGGIKVNLSHFPYDGDSHEQDRHAEFRMKDDGITPIVHGHVHDEFATRGRQYNVGVDVHNLQPVSEDEIAEWLRTL